MIELNLNLMPEHVPLERVAVERVAVRCKPKARTAKGAASRLDN